MSELPNWSRALTLSERDFHFPPHEIPDGFDAALAERRAETWKQETGLKKPAHFSLRLAQQDFEETRFLHLLGSPPPSVEDPPVWWSQLRVAYTRPPIDEFAAFWKKSLAEQTDGIFLDFLRPLLDFARQNLAERLEALETSPASAPILNHFVRLWAESLPQQFLRMASRTLILELYLRRLQGHLEGTTPEQRFESFLNSLCEPEGALEFFSQYPVLARSLMLRCTQWVETGFDLAGRLAKDAPQLAENFAEDESLGDLIGLEPGVSDRHQNGRTVVLLKFSSGTTIVYKPRSPALDVEFQKLLAWLGDQGVQPRLRTLRILDRETYGWFEFIEATPCRSEEEVHRFYARQGIYLALLYALEATDFHHENLIAAGEHPVLIDLETIFQPALADSDQQRELLNPVLTTVLRSGLLPRGFDTVDLSGLNARRGQPSPVREIVRAGTDEMGFVDRLQDFPVGNHLPSLNGREIPLISMEKILCESFDAAYRKLMELRPEFLRAGGRLDRFAGMETRVIVRPTQIYVYLGYTAYHPDYLQDFLHRERLFDKLWLDADLLPWIREAIPAERRDLLRGDVPRFNTYTDSCDLFAEDFLLENALPQSGLEQARRRVESLDEQDLERQSMLLRLSLASIRSFDAPLEDDVRAPVVLPRAAAPAPESFLAAAQKTGERLDSLAFHASNWISWFHLAPNPNNTQSLLPVGFDLYSGLGGIALFYAHLARLTKERRWEETARTALFTGRQRFEGRPVLQSEQIGGFSGVGSWIYTLTHLGALWDRADLLDEAEAASVLVAPAVAGDEGLDVIAGSAGCLGALLALARLRPSPTVLDAAIACGDHLLARAEDQDHGKAWRIALIGDLPLTGFAHGAAGMAWALGRLAAQTGERRFEEGARAALAYERSLFSPEAHNWPDLRIDRLQNGQWAFFHAWCHGSPGIGLSRLDLLDVLDDDTLVEEVRAAVRSTEKFGFGGSQCLCHGDLGNLELLSRAADRLHDEELKARTDLLAGRILAGLERDGYRCGVSSRVELPGLLTGLAGIGYGLLRIAAPKEIPSVLLMELPATNL